MQNAKCKLRSPILIVFAFCILHSAFAAEGPLHIGKITINSVDVYSEKEATKGRFYRAADALHIETHDSVIRKFLLFHEGEVYRPERLAETERALRALHFLKSASVTASE
ncbi:MAG: hypothetical protein ACREMY_17140, partial [bacterium]